MSQALLTLSFGETLAIWLLDQCFSFQFFAYLGWQAYLETHQWSLPDEDDVPTPPGGGLKKDRLPAGLFLWANDIFLILLRYVSDTYG